MIGVYDFCGHYDWTFEYLRERGGRELVRDYWKEAICEDSQRHAAQLIERDGFSGMRAYWGHTLDHEAAGYSLTERTNVFRIDMHACPSKGFLLRNHIEHYPDYCDHCIGWIGPMMEKAGVVIDHEHNHRGLCWWEMRSRDDPTPPSVSGRLAEHNDVRRRDDWNDGTTPLDRYSRATDPDDKETEQEP